MDTIVPISEEAMRRLIKRIDARPVPARLRPPDAELLAERLRRIPQADLRRRISVGEILTQ